MRESDIEIIHPDSRETHVNLEQCGIPAIERLGIHVVSHADERKRYEITHVNRPNHMFIITVSGKGLIQGPQGPQNALPGSMWFSPARTYRHWGLDGDAWEFVRIVIRPGNRHWEPLVSRLAEGMYRARWQRIIRTSVLSIARERSGGELDADELCTGYARQISIYLERLIRQGEAGRDTRDGQRTMLQNMLDEVQYDPGRDWTVKALIETSGVYACPDHFTRLCREMCGHTPRELVAGIRMRKARELLACTDYTLEVLAGMLGYRSPYAFSAAFKRHAGVSPGSYRKTTQSESAQSN